MAPKFAAKLSLGVPALLAEAGGCGTHALLSELETQSTRTCLWDRERTTGSTILAETPTSSVMLGGSHGSTNKRRRTSVGSKKW